MKRLSAIAMGLFIAGATAFSVSHQVAAQTAAAWGTLIDGTKGLDNFIQRGNANWRVMDDGIGANAGNGFLVSKESYQDFRIRAEVWVDTPANSDRCSRMRQAGPGEPSRGRPSLAYCKRRASSPATRRPCDANRL